MPRDALMPPPTTLYADDEEGLAGVSVVPERMYLIDVRKAYELSQSASEDGQDARDSYLNAQFNPTELEEQLKVDWAKMKSHGLSHRPLHYVGTENTEYSFELVFDSRAGTWSREEVVRAHRFLRSLCYPKKGASDVRQGQAATVYFVWPNFLSFQCVINEVTFKHETFEVEGGLSRFVAKVKIEELRDTRVYSEDVYEGE